MKGTVIQIGSFKEKRKDMDTKALIKRLDEASKKAPSKSLERQYREKLKPEW